MDGKSLNITQELLDQLQYLLPDVFTEGQIDWERLRLALGDNLAHPKDHYELSWAGKAEARKEIQKQTTATLIPQREQSINFDTTENIIIEGENLEVLRALQRSYFGKVKMIYIDPPYNTGKDSFIYPDDYFERLKDYKERAGITDENGFLNKYDLWKANSKENGHFHSVWLSMMYPRLFLARNLLREDGVIFVSIDDNEQANLKLLMDEVFGRDNFVGTFVWKRRTSSGFADNNVSTDHEYVIAYQKGYLNKFYGIKKDFKGYSNPDNDPRGAYVLGDLTVGMTASMRPNQAYDLIDPKTNNVFNYNPNRVWAYIPESMNKLIAEDKIYFPQDTSKRPMIKRFQNELESLFNPISSIIIDKVGLNTEATRTVQELLGGNVFDYSKPISLIKLLVSQVCDDSDLILDFFAGSGTTGQAVLELNAEDGGNRRFILVQYPEPTDDNSEAKKAGYDTIADITRARINKVIEKLKTNPTLESGTQDLGFKAYRLALSNFKQWRGDVSGKEAILEQLGMFKDDLVQAESTPENILQELLLKNGLPLTVKPEEVISGDGMIYHLPEEKICLCLEGFEQDALSKVKDLKPRKVLVLNQFMEREGDVFATNAHLELKDAGIELELV